MELKEIIEIVKGELLVNASTEEQHFEFAFSSDLMSDVLTIRKTNMILITGLTNKQTLHTANIAEISLIIFGRNKRIESELIDLALENNIALIRSPFSIFRISGMLFQKGIQPVY